MYQILMILLVAIIITFGSHVLEAQSTSPANATPLNGSYTGKGPDKETNYYFSITAGPGNVSVRLEIKPKDYSTFARIEIGNDPANLIAMHNMNASTTTGPTIVVKEFGLVNKQTVRIKLILDANLAEYTVSVGGAVHASGGLAPVTAEVFPGRIGTPANPGIEPKTSPSGNSTRSKPTQVRSDKMSQGIGEIRRNEISLTCPKDVTYEIVPVADWNATLYVIKRLVFDNASVSGGKLYCTYTAASGPNTDSSTLTRSAPTGFVCSVYNAGSRSDTFACKRGIMSAASQTVQSRKRFGEREKI